MDKLPGPWFMAAEVERLVEALPKKLPPYFGCVYAVEYGGLLKVGQTCRPWTRLKALASQAKHYGPGYVGKAVLTPPHTNYAENERRLHQMFANRRVKGELFRLSLDEFLDAAKDLDLRDDSKKLAARSEAVFQFFKSIATGEWEVLVR